MPQGMFGRARAYFRERAYQTKSSDRAHILKGPLIDCRSFGVVGKPEDISFNIKIIKLLPFSKPFGR